MAVCGHRLLPHLLSDPHGGRYVCFGCGWLLLATYAIRLDGAAESSFLPLKAPKSERLLADEVSSF